MEKYIGPSEYTFLKESDNVAISNLGSNISYRLLYRFANEWSQKFEIQSNDHVIIYSENRPEWIYAFYAIWMRDSIVVPVDFMSTEEELKYILEDCKPTLIIYSKDKEGVVKSAMQGITFGIKTFQLDTPHPVTLASSLSPANFITKDTQKTALIIYTSGTTGSPKGVMLSFQNIIINLNSVIDIFHIYQQGECTMALLPFHHIFPLLGTVVAPIASQGIVAIAPAMTGEAIMETLQKNKVNIIIGVPRLFEMIAKGIKDKINASAIAKMLYSFADRAQSSKLSRVIFSSVHKKFGGGVKFMVSGGAALDKEVGQTFKTLGFEILEGFGMTEAAPMITFTRPGDVIIGSTGKAMPGVEVEIRNGEICARGNNIMKGYYNRPEETTEVIKDGWLHTGDLGEIDEKGYLRVTGRKKEIIILPNGKNVNPIEIEQKLLSNNPILDEIGVFQHEGVLQAAFVVRKDLSQEETQVSLEALVHNYNKKVSPYKRILKFHLFNQELPKTRLGKLKRFQLPNLILGQAIKEDIEEPDFEEFTMVKNYLQKETGMIVRALDNLEFDIPLDSLSRVGFLVYLENTFGIKLDEEKLQSFPNIVKLSEYLREKKNKLEETVINWSEILKEKKQLTLPKTWFTTNLFATISKGLFSIMLKIRTTGKENIPKGPVIIAPNHQSFLDGLFIAINLKSKTLSNTYFYAKAKHVRLPIVKFLANHNNVIVMDISKDLKTSIQKLAIVLKKGKNVIIFPEGTRSIDGQVGSFKQLFAILSKELNVPVVPVSISGAHKVLPKGAKFPKLGKEVHIDFLKPIMPQKQDYQQLANEIRNIIAEKVQAIQGA